MIENLRGDKHVAVLSAGEKEVTILQNHYRLLHTVVHKWNPEVGADHFPPLADLDWSLHQTYHVWERYPVDPRVRWRKGVLPL